MSQPDPVESVVAEAAPAKAPPVTTAKTAAQLELLGGDEIVQLSIKPSLWFIPLVSFNVLLLLTFVAAGFALAMRAGATPANAAPFQVLTALVALRIGLATLQWASRLYVLTNRRVMRFHGVLNVTVAECPLVRISAVDVHSHWGWRAVRVGSIRMRSAENASPPVAWDDVARPEEVHELLVRAIRKAQSKD